MLTISPPQAVAALQSLAFFQSLARPGGPAFEPMLEVNWIRTAQEFGLRGNPQNPWNSLMQHSRLLQATSPTGETCLGLFLLHQPDYESGELYLAPRCQGLQAAFRLEMPAVFRSYKHCTDPLTDEEPTYLRTHALDAKGRLQTRGFVRLKDLWKQGDAGIDHGRVRYFASHPGELAALGALQVTRAFDASDLRWAPSPWARFVLQTNGLEGAVAARDLGMGWILADENPSAPPGGVFSHGPL
ncbi:MAG TPA: hypothetical protein VLJ37_08465 [bacterium]|nr:hypothetical protein [bacterium]